MKKFFNEFKTFVSKGNVLDLAVAFIIGAAFKDIINSLVKDILTPVLSLIVGDEGFGNFKYVYHKQEDDISLLDNSNSDSAKMFYNNIYAQLKKTRIPTVIEPHKYSYTGNNTDEVLISNMVVPIMNETQFLGIAGVDAPMMYVQQSFSNLKPMENGKVYIITHSGEFLSHPESNYLNKTFQEYAPDIESRFNITSLIKEGIELEFEATEPTSGENSLFVFKPIYIGNSEKPWSFVISVPLDTIYL